MNIPNLIKILLPNKNISFYKLKPEQKICIDFANYLREQTLSKEFPYVWFHIPNEFSSYNAVYGLKQGWMGRISGAPDFCFLSKNNNFFIEFKTKTGRQNPSQKIFQEWCTINQINYLMARSCEEGIKIIEDFLANEKT